MVLAYVLFKIIPGNENEVVSLLKEYEEVKEISTIYGIYDIICKVETKTDKDLSTFILSVRQKLVHVRETMTLISAEKHK